MSSPFTDKGKFATLIAICAALQLWLVNSDLLKWSDVQDEILSAKKASLHVDQHPNAVIVGGSNAYYGLSAEVLSQKTSLRFVNLALLREGNGWDNYVRYLTGLDFLDRNQIEVVVYSTLDIANFAWAKGVEDREEDLLGRKTGFLLFDSRSWVVKLYHQLFVGTPQDVRDRTDINSHTGDILFHTGTCGGDFDRFEVQPPAPSLALIEERLEHLSKLFPNARVFLRIPPLAAEMLEGYSLNRLYQDVSARARVQGIPLLNDDRQTFRQSWACDSPYHPNSRGRRNLSLRAAMKLNRLSHHTVTSKPSSGARAPAGSSS